MISLLDGNVKSVNLHGNNHGEVMEHAKKHISKIMEKYDKVSPELIMQKMKVTQEVAESICAVIWIEKAKEFFYLRNFGVTTEEFNKGDFLDNPRIRTDLGWY